MTKLSWLQTGAILTLTILIILAGCSSPNGNSSNQLSSKVCGSDWECIQASLNNCTPMEANINFEDTFYGSVQGRLNLIGPEKDTTHQIYGCGADYATDKPISRNEKLRGHLIIEKSKTFEKLIDLITYLETGLADSGQVLPQMALAVEPEGFQKYKNEKYNFSIMYPNGWKVTEEKVNEETTATSITTLESPDKAAIVFIVSASDGMLHFQGINDIDAWLTLVSYTKKNYQIFNASMATFSSKGQGVFAVFYKATTNEAYEKYSPELGNITGTFFIW